MNKVRTKVILFGGLALLVAALAVIAFRPSGHHTQVLSVGSILGLTGDNAAYGVKMRRGLESAVDQINKGGGIKGKKLNLIVDDSQWDPRAGVSIYRKLHDVNGVRLFSAICGSKVALAICEASRDDSVVILDAISTVPKLSQYGGKKYFRICASEAHAGRNNVDWAVEEGAKSFLIVYVEDEWGTSYRDALQEVLASKGQSVSVLPVDLKSRDLRVEAQKAAEKKADAIFLVLYANLAMPFIQQAKVYGLSGKVYGGDNLSSTDFSVAGADATEGVRISLPAEPNSPAFSSFQKDYHDRFAEDPDVFAIKSYDALMLLAHAVDTAGDDPVAVAEYLRTMKPYEGISGPISFDAHGDLAQQKYQRLVYVAGKLKPWHK